MCVCHCGSGRGIVRPGMVGCSSDTSIVSILLGPQRPMGFSGCVSITWQHSRSNGVGLWLPDLGMVRQMMKSSRG